MNVIILLIERSIFFSLYISISLVVIVCLFFFCVPILTIDNTVEVLFQKSTLEKNDWKLIVYHIIITVAFILILM